jgi:hypothetical protein
MVTGQAVRSFPSVSELARSLGKFGQLFAQQDSERGILLGFHANIPSANQTVELAHLAQIPIPRSNSVHPNINEIWQSIFLSLEKILLLNQNQVQTMQYKSLSQHEGNCTCRQIVQGRFSPNVPWA